MLLVFVLNGNVAFFSQEEFVHNLSATLGRLGALPGATAGTLDEALAGLEARLQGISHEHTARPVRVQLTQRPVDRFLRHHFPLYDPATVLEPLYNRAIRLVLKM